MIYSFTGHRPPKLGGYSPQAQDRLYHFAIRTLAELDPEEAIVGMALGWDTAVAWACLYLDIPYVAAVPFVGQELAWPGVSQRAYDILLNSAARVEVISAGGYTPSAMQQRNEWMVDHSGKLVALWNGSAGGTGNCVAYAKRKSVEVVGVWPHWEDFPKK